jgi:O-antigen/teichoic acid export membrane protein
VLEKVKPLAYRFLMILGGEGLQSAFAFALNISLARTLPATLYGVFAIVVLMGGFGIIYMRALLGVPACIYIPNSRSRDAARLYAVMFGSGALIVSLLAAAVVALSLIPWYSTGALAGGAFVGALSLRHYIRMALFAQGRAILATTSDVVFTSVAAGLCALLVWRGAGDTLLRDVFLALASAHSVAIAVALAALRQPIRLSLRRSIRRRFAAMLPSMTWSIIGVTMANIQGQGAILLLSVIAGPAAYAPIAVTMTFFSPLRITASAVKNMLQPEISDTGTPASARRATDRILGGAAVIGAVCALYGAAIIWAYPAIARIVFAGRFGDAPLERIALYVWGTASVVALYYVPLALLEVRRDFKAITVVTAIGAAIFIPLVALLLETTSPAGALAGILGSESLVFVGYWALAGRALGARGTPTRERDVFDPFGFTRGRPTAPARLGAETEATMKSARRAKRATLVS